MDEKIKYIEMSISRRVPFESIMRAQAPYVGYEKELLLYIYTLEARVKKLEEVLKFYNRIKKEVGRNHGKIRCDKDQ